MDYRPKIKLSQDEFRVLASSTRIDILKLLDASQFTVSDVARRLGMNKATVHEHLTKLMEVGLVKKEESPRKWVYYQLTWKGRNLLHPERVKVMVTLATLALVIAIGALLMVSQTPLVGPDSDINDINPNDIQSPYANIMWMAGTGTSNEYDIKFEGTNIPLSMASVTELDTFIEANPTSISRNRPVDLRWTREGDIIHIHDFDNLLDDYEGEYLYVEGAVLDDRGIQRNFNLRRYLVPEGLKIDLRIGPLGIVIDTENINETGLVSVTFAVENVGNLNANATPIEVFSVKRGFRATGFPVYGSPYLNELYNGTVDLVVNGSKNVTFQVPVSQLFMRGIMVFVDPNNEIPEEAPVDDNRATTALPEAVLNHNEDQIGPNDTIEETNPVMGLIAMGIAVAIIVAFAIIGYLLNSMR